MAKRYTELWPQIADKDNIHKGLHLAVKNKQCLVLQYELEDSSNLYVSFTNSVVLMRQIEEYTSELPFETIIVKRSNYYTFT